MASRTGQFAMCLGPFNCRMEFITCHRKNRIAGKPPLPAGKTAMPELPEVECLTRSLNRDCPIGPLVACHILDPRILRGRGANHPDSWGQEIIGSCLLGFGRRGKFWWMDWSDPQTGGKHSSVSGHLGMTGRLFFSRPGPEKMPDHLVARFVFPDAELFFTDMRRFGFLSWDMDVLNRLAGPDPISPEWLSAAWPAKVRRSQRDLKCLLMDQSIVAGLGNIYVCETLFDAGIHPWTKACDCGEDQWKSLRKSIYHVLNRGLKFGLALDLDLSGQASANRLFYFGTRSSDAQQKPEFFHVYDREGLGCRRCHSRIRRDRQSGRSTYWCPHCQPLE